MIIVTRWLFPRIGGFILGSLDEGSSCFRPLSSGGPVGSP